MNRNVLDLPSSEKTSIELCLSLPLAVSVCVCPYVSEHDNYKTQRARWMKFRIRSLQENCRCVPNFGQNLSYGNDTLP